MQATAERVVSSTQEQATASWINYLNQMRLDELVAKLQQQDQNLEASLETLAALKEAVDHVITSDRGGVKGMHGFLAEVTECGFGNARALIEGQEPVYEWVNDNGPVDMVRNGVNIQQKFSQANGHYSLDAVKEHLDHYPDFLKNGGKYQIPKDFYEIVKKVADMKGDLSSLNANTVPTLSQAKWITEFLENSGITLDDLEPSALNYRDVQKGTVKKTIDNEEKEIKDRDKERRKEAYDESKPTLREGAKATAVSAVTEGGVAFCMAIAAKCKSGKKISEFDEKDWKEIAGKTGLSTVKGGIRGASIYTLTNFTATPASVASAYVTALFGIAAQVRELNNGNVSKEDFVINCETVCLDVGVSAIASLAGQVLIPVPVIGAVIGNIAGQFAYEICKKYGGKKSADLIAKYQREMEILNQQLQLQYMQVILEIRQAFKKFKSLEELAFDTNVNKAFLASVELGRYVGVFEDALLKTVQEVDDYFLN